MTQVKTDTVIKTEGMNALIENLGAVDAERFVALINRESFDYTQWRKTHLPNDDVRTLSRNAAAYTAKEKKSKKDE